MAKDKTSLVIVIDFDGTCVSHEFPKVGKDVGAVRVLKRIVENGHRLVLFTMRSNIEKPISNNPDIHTEGGNYLTDALNWFEKNNIPLFGVQTNPEQKSWTSSPKVYGQIYIDDAALGCPLLYNGNISDRHYVDWEMVEYHLYNMGIFEDYILEC